VSGYWSVCATGKQEEVLGAFKHELNGPRESVIGSSVKHHLCDGDDVQPDHCCGTGLKQIVLD
jgi:hypothetical protein